MKASELRKLTEAELAEKITEHEKALTDLRFKKAITGQIEKPHLLAEHRRIVATIKTILRERQISTENA